MLAEAVNMAEMPNPSVNDAVVGVINHDLCHDDAMVRDWWQDGRCRAIRHVRQNQIKKNIATSRFMHTLRDAFSYTHVLKDLTSAGITNQKTAAIERDGYSCHPPRWSQPSLWTNAVIPQPAE